jgi:sensory rhodopsin
MTIVSTAYGITAAGFLIGVGIFALLYTELDGSDDRRWLAYLVVIPGFAGLMYALMALGIGNIEFDGGTLVVPRYVDWIVTTPLLVGFVGYVAGASRRSIAGVMIADALMITIGMGAVAFTGTLKWVFFGASSLFHLSLFGYLYVVFPKTVPDAPMRYGLFTLLKHHIGLLWIAYPFVWLMAPTGVGYITVAGASLTFAFLDLLAKVPYVYFFYARRHVFTTESTTGESDLDVTAAD